MKYNPRLLYNVSLGILLSFCIAIAAKKQYRQVENDSFQAGENFTYKIKYGILTVGQANIDVHQRIFDVHERPCYRVNVLGKTAGLTSIWKIKNTYRSFIDTLALIPHKFVYNAREGNYSRDQSFDFDQHRNLVVKQEKQKHTEYKVPENVHDVISGYYYLRTINFAKRNVGTSITTPMFFDDRLYDMKVKYVGRETVKTRFGSIATLKLLPILPHNDLFEGEEAIRIFVSDDANKVPVRIEIDFSFGTVAMELHNYKNVRHAFKWAKK